MCISQKTPTLRGEGTGRKVCPGCVQAKQTACWQSSHISSPTLPQLHSNRRRWVFRLPPLCTLLSQSRQRRSSHSVQSTSALEWLHSSQFIYLLRLPKIQTLIPSPTCALAHLSITYLPLHLNGRGAETAPEEMVGCFSPLPLCSFFLLHYAFKLPAPVQNNCPPSLVIL